MLILSRKKNESVMIDDDIKVIVLGMKGDKILLGFDAPHTVAVHRKEVYLRNKNAKKSAYLLKKLSTCHCES